MMTSGNRSDEPIAYEDDDAARPAAGIADLFLVHNRPIHVRCDDSVTRRGRSRRELPIRRSRGYAPQPIDLPIECPVPILAVGGQLKATFALRTRAARRFSAITWATSIISRPSAPSSAISSCTSDLFRARPARHRPRSPSRLRLDALCLRRCDAEKGLQLSGRAASSCAHGELHGRAWPRPSR